MTAFARSFVPVLAALALVSSASAEPPKPKLALIAPQDLHGFLLRADEPRVDTFSRTPSFAWTPLRGAARYEFQLSTSNGFRDNGIVFEDENVKGATLAPPISLPWMTGKPYALYARVRAVLPSGGVTPWSESVGFNMRWKTVPAPLTSYPGLLRWTPVEGATGYQVWLVDADKVFETTSNTADEREYYTLHQDAVWTGSVRWRVRASRILYGTRNNGLQAVSYGPWSSVPGTLPNYTSVNPAFAAGPLTLTAATSDVVSDSSSAAAPHRLMPGFAFSGNQSLDGVAHELFRVYVFTDEDCVNLVYRGAIVGGPAYAPRSTGPLKLPATRGDLDDARDAYLDDGDEPDTFYKDGMKIQTTESDPGLSEASDQFAGRRLGPAPFPGTGTDGSGSGDTGSTPGADAGAPGSGSDSGTSSGTDSGSGSDTESGSADNDADAASPPANTSAAGGAAGAGTSLPLSQTDLGAPVDLPDTDWPSGGYYWTVVPVKPVFMDPVRTSITTAAVAGSATVVVANVEGLAADDEVRIGTGGTEETKTILSVNTTTNTLTLTAPLTSNHSVGERVVGPSDKVAYRDQDLPQDACAQGRVQRFGKASEPTVMSSTTPFVSGLSPTGRLISAAAKNTVFYGSPLVSWTPALGADAYEVQWSETSYPFKVAGSQYTFATSASLSMKPGTWYYRVRGLNLSLVGAAQRMSWSDPVKIEVAGATFSVLGGATKASAIAKSTTKTVKLSHITVEEAGFSVGVPSGWEAVDQNAESLLLFEAVAPQADQGFYSNMNVVAGAGRGKLSMSQWASALKAEVATLPLVAKSLSTKVVKLRAGNAVKLNYKLKTPDGRQVAILQYAIDAGEASFVITYTTATTLSSKYASLFAASANSFSIED